jgi:hypothetical protein
MNVMSDVCRHGQAWYVVRVRGTVAAAWSCLFGGFTIAHDPTGDTIISGEVIDQAAFYGLMSRVRDLGLTVLSVERREGTDENFLANPGASKGGRTSQA